MQLAPIALFVYNRPNHTLKTLEALVKNKYFVDSQLYIFSDGPPSDDLLNKALVTEVRTLLQEITLAYNPIFIERVSNFGLAKNITEGISFVLEQHESIIVLEDDIVTSVGFLDYMNSALNLYKSHNEVMHVSGYMFPVNGKLPETFFFNTASCWGWGTWRHSWEKYESNTGKLIEQFESTEQVYHFNIEGDYDYYNQLIRNHSQSMETWAVKWYASIFFQNGYCLHPRKSLTQNIGNDGTGMNSSKSIQFDHKKIASHIDVQPIQIQESKKARNKVRAYYRKHKNTKSFLTQLKSLFSAIFSEKISLAGKTLLDHSLRKKTAELNKVLNTPRFIGSSTNLLKKKVYFNDSASFLFTYKEIFENKVYDFVSSVDRPLIIDAGSNIGLATVRFKELFPNAHIKAIEADKLICELMKKNFDSFNFQDVEIINAALWSHEGEIYFDSAGADSGRVAKEGIASVRSILLSNLIDQPIEMVKMDIEGAELNVIKEAKSKLHFVKRMFIEYHSFIKSEQNLDELLSILRDSGFRYYLSSPGVSNKNPFNTLGKRGYMGMDFQLNIHAERQ